MREKLGRYQPLIVSVLIIYLFIHYWDFIIHLIVVGIGAATPLIFGCVMAYIVNIIMNIYEHRVFSKICNGKMKAAIRPCSLIFAFFTVILIILFLISMVVPQLIESINIIITQLPNQLDILFKNLQKHPLITDLLMGIPNIDELVTNGQIDWQSIVSKAGMFMIDGLSSAVGSVVGFVSSMFSTLISIILALIFSIYLLTGKEKLSKQMDKLFRAYVKKTSRVKLYHVFDVLNCSYHSYIVGQVTDAFILGIMCAVLMTVFQFPYAAMIGSLVGFCGLIPILGGYIGAAIGTFMILTVSPVRSIFFLVFIIVLQQIDGNLIYPRVMGNKLGLPGMWVLAAVTIGGGIMGIPGMILGVPFAGAMYKLLREDVNKREANRDKDD